MTDVSTEGALDETGCLALAEVVNIALGHAAGPLSELIGCHVALSVPVVDQVPVEQIPSQLSGIFGAGAEIHLVGQSFRPQLRGECWLVLHDPDRQMVSRMLGSETVLEPEEDRAAVLELANIVIACCVGKVSEILTASTSFSPPVLHLYSAPVGDIGGLLDGELDASLLIRTGFRLEGTGDFEGLLIVLLPKSHLDWLVGALDRFVEGL